MSATIRESVTHYLDHLQDIPWIEALFAEHGLVPVLEECAQVLAGADPEEVQAVDTFLRDIGTEVRGPSPRETMKDDEIPRQSRALMPSIIFPALRPLLWAPDLAIRRSAIYTFGKLSFPSEAEALREAFPAYLERDPFCLARLLFELAWLGSPSDVQACLPRVVDHESYLIRWAALGFLSCRGTPEPSEMELTQQWLRALSADSAAPVRDEARYQLARLDLEAAGNKALWRPKPYWQSQRHELEQLAPPVDFDQLEVAFGDEMARTGQRDYSLEELDAWFRAAFPV